MRENQKVHFQRSEYASVHTDDVGRGDEKKRVGRPLQKKASSLRTMVSMMLAANAITLAIALFSFTSTARAIVDIARAGILHMLSLWDWIKIVCYMSACLALVGISSYFVHHSAKVFYLIRSGDEDQVIEVLAFAIDPDKKSDPSDKEEDNDVASRISSGSVSHEKSIESTESGECSLAQGKSGRESVLLHSSSFQRRGDNDRSYITNDDSVGEVEGNREARTDAEKTRCAGNESVGKSFGTRRVVPTAPPLEDGQKVESSGKRANFPGVREEGGATVEGVDASAAKPLVSVKVEGSEEQRQSRGTGSCIVTEESRLSAEKYPFVYTRPFSSTPRCISRVECIYEVPKCSLGEEEKQNSFAASSDSVITSLGDKETESYMQEVFVSISSDEGLKEHYVSDSVFSDGEDKTPQKRGKESITSVISDSLSYDEEETHSCQDDPSNRLDCCKVLDTGETKLAV